MTEVTQVDMERAAVMRGFDSYEELVETGLVSDKDDADFDAIHLARHRAAAVAQVAAECQRLHTLAKANNDLVRMLTAERDALRDPAAVGESVISAVADLTSQDGPLKGWHPADCPSEVVYDLYNLAVESADELTTLRAKLDEAVDCLHDATCIIGHLVPMDAYALVGKKLVAKEVWEKARAFLSGEAGVMRTGKFDLGAQAMKDEIDAYLLDLIARRIAERPSRRPNLNDEVIDATRRAILSLPLPELKP